MLRDGAARRPTLSAAEDMMYSNDPVFVFGSKLRQGRFERRTLICANLNHPAAMANFSASATATWTAFDAGSAHRNIESAQSTLPAARIIRSIHDERTRNGDHATLLSVYFSPKIRLRSQRLRLAGKGTLLRYQDRERSGFSLESDKMRTKLARRSAEDDLAAARANVALARRDLFDAIGEPDSGRALCAPFR